MPITLVFSKDDDELRTLFIKSVIELINKTQIKKKGRHLEGHFLEEEIKLIQHETKNKATLTRKIGHAHTKYFECVFEF